MAKFYSFGDNNVERFKHIGELICQEDIDVIILNLYTWRHYETVRTIDVANEQVEVLNSLGERSGEGFLGFREWRSFDEYEKYIARARDEINTLCICFIYKTKY